MSRLAFFALATIATAPMLVDCKKEPEPTPSPAATAASTSGASTTADASGQVSDAAPNDDPKLRAALIDADERAYVNAAPEEGKSIGHTSVVFKLRLVGGFDAAWKPRSKRGGFRYKGEIAAHRLARALGIPNVPRAMPRSFKLDELRSAMAAHPDAQKLLDDEAVPESDGTVRGALIPWIPDLEFLPLENAEWRAKWEGWLKGSVAIPDDQKKLAEQIAEMILFDYVTGNWDRWSGGNVGFDRATTTLLFIDNDGSFYDVPPARFTAQQRDKVKMLRLVPSSFVAALRRMDDAALRAALGSEDPRDPKTPLLSARAMDGAEARLIEALKMLERADAGDL